MFLIDATLANIENKRLNQSFKSVFFTLRGGMLGSVQNKTLILACDFTWNAPWNDIRIISNASEPKSRISV